MFGYYTEISLANSLALRCHVQPAATISVHKHRPQCADGTFSKQPFKYTLKKKQFDPELTYYWKRLTFLKDGTDPGLIKLDKEGNLEVTYDYNQFGCPLQPYRDEPFVPDLRIASKDTKFNSSLGSLYNGTFLLIEMFGAKGFKFAKTFKDLHCEFVPINVTKYIRDWVVRQRMFRLAANRQTSPTEQAQIDSAKDNDELNALEYGNQLFVGTAADHPLNIINRVTYRDCKKWTEFLRPSENGTWRFDSIDPARKIELESQILPIMKRGAGNTISWSKDGPPIYVFLAIALDPTESLCEYYTIFGVSIPDNVDTSAWITFLVFLLILLLWIGLFLCGFQWRKSAIRDLSIELERKRHLEEAAWKVVYRYEKLLQEHENYHYEQEIREFRQREADKLRLRLEKKLAQARRLTQERKLAEILEANKAAGRTPPAPTTATSAKSRGSSGKAGGVGGPDTLPKMEEEQEQGAAVRFEMGTGQPSRNSGEKRKSSKSKSKSKEGMKKSSSTGGQESPSARQSDPKKNQRNSQEKRNSNK